MIRGNTNIVQLAWYDKATITANVDAQDDEGFDTGEETTLVENEPCKVVKKTLNAGQQGFFDNVKYTALLLISNDVEVPKGANITITDVNGKKQLYKLASGGYSNYTTHQEIAMTVDDKA